MPCPLTSVGVSHDDHAGVLVGVTSLHISTARGSGACTHLTAQWVPCSVESRALVKGGVVCGPRLWTESRGGWGGRSEGGRKGISLIVLGRGIGSCPGSCPKLRQRRGGAPAKLLSGVGSDSTREQVYLITRLGTLDARAL